MTSKNFIFTKENSILKWKFSGKKRPDFSFEGSWDWQKADFENINNFPSRIFILKLAAALKKQNQKPIEAQTSPFTNSFNSSLTENTQCWKNFT